MMGDDTPLPLDEPSVARLPNTHAHTILNGRLYLGPAHTASDKDAIKADGITHILNITKEIDKQQYNAGVTVCHLECYDSPQQRLPFGEAAAFIHQCINNEDDAETVGKCLVHCNAGQSLRSASIIIYYLMTKSHTLKQSYHYVKSRKPDIRPNFGFCVPSSKMKLFGKISLDMNDYKADTLCDILEGSGKTREDVLGSLKWARGDGELALGMLLE